MTQARSRIRLCSLAVAATLAMGLGACSKSGDDVAPPPAPTAAASLPPPVVAQTPAPAPVTAAPAQAPVVVAQNDTGYDQGRRDQRAQDLRAQEQRRARAERERAAERPLPPRADRDSDVNDSRHVQHDRQVAAAACPNCGVVESIEVVEVQGKTNGVGAVAGGVGGALVGNRIAGSNNRTLGGVVGAVGGGLLGNAIEKHQRKETAYDVRVRMNDGTLRTVRESTSPAVGEKVRVEADGLHART